MSSEHTNFIRNSRKFLHCGECGRPFDTVNYKPRVLGCGHNVCELCMNSQRLSMGSKCCMVCACTEDVSAPVSHDLLGIVFGKEQAMKRVPLKYRCGECTTLYRENDMTVCRTCSGWSEGMQTEEATDFAKRPISSLICWCCAGHHRHANHDKMSLDIINRIWDTPIAMEFIETQLGTAEKLLDLLRGGAITQINQLADCFSVKLEEFKLKIRNGQFPLDSTSHITKAVDVISGQIRRWNLGIQKSSEDAHLLIEYFETLLKHVVETPQRSGSGKWDHQPTRPTTEPEVLEDIKMVIKRNMRELKTALPINDELKLSQSPEVVDRLQRSSETTTNATTEETPTRKRALPVEPVEPQPQMEPQQQQPQQLQQHQQHQHHQQFAPFFSPDDYLDRPRRVNTKKNYAIEDDVEPEVAPRKRGRKKAEVTGDDNGMGGMNGNGGLSPYNMSGTHLANDPLVNQSTSSVSPVRRAPTYKRGRGKRRGFRGGRGSRGGYRHLAVPMSNPVLEDPVDELEAHHPMPHDHDDHLYDNDLHVDPLHDPLRSSFEDSDQDRMQSHETPPVTERTTEQLFQELIGSSTSGAVSSCGASGGGGQPGDGHGPSPPPLSQNSSPPPPFVGQPHKTIMPVDFLGQTDGSRQLGSPYGDGLGHQIQQTWEDLNQDAQFGCGPMADYYHCAPANMDATSFVNNTPPY